MTIQERVEELERLVKDTITKLDAIIDGKKSNESYKEHNKSIKEESPREFFLKFHPKNDTEKTLIAIYFLEKRGIQSITIKEISDALKEMRESLPKNISDKIQLLDKRGLVKIIGHDGKRKCWVVSNSGEDYLRGLGENGK